MESVASLEQVAVDTIGESWAQVLGSVFSKDYMRILSATLQRERSKYTIYPAQEDVFKAYKLTPYEKIKVVIVGQDPYHNGAADGLAFSSKNENFVPASLRNIFKEIGIEGASPNLKRWAEQGVFLINTCLSVRKASPFSHQGIGWQYFTTDTIKALSNRQERIYFMLWGSHAKKHREYIDPIKHTVLTAAHPSPFSAHKGFFGCNHFKAVNNFLEQDGIKKIDW